MPEVLRRMKGLEGQSGQEVPRVHQPRHGPDLPSRGPRQDLGDVPQLRDRAPLEPQGGERPQKLVARGPRVEL